MIKLFKGRKLNRRAPVRVHRNLHRKTYSIVQGGQVVAHAEKLALRDVKFVVSDAGWRRSILKGFRTVHAHVAGMLCQPPDPKAYRYSFGARYNRRTGSFEVIASQRKLTEEPMVTLTHTGMRVIW